MKLTHFLFELIEVSEEQAEKLAHVLTTLGLNAEFITQETNAMHPLGGDLEDSKEQQPIVEIGVAKPKPMTPKAAKKGVSLDIPPEALDAARRFFELGKEAGGWYYEAHETLRRVFKNEQDLVLFCMILAATSVQNEVYTNFVEAAVVFNALKLDVNTQPQRLRLAVEELTSGASIQTVQQLYPSLNVFKSIDTIKLLVRGAKFGNIFRVLKLWLDKGQLDIASTRTALINSLKSKTLSKKDYMTLEPEELFTANKPFIGQMKIANYALTLLDPGYAGSSEDAMNVVIDTWMWRVFYPNMLQQGMNQDQALKTISKLFRSKEAYSNAVEATKQLAKEADVSPHVMQAAIWTGIKKTWEGEAQGSESNYISTINSLIDKYLQGIKDIKDETQRIVEVLRNLTPNVANNIIHDRQTAHILRIVNRNIAKRKAAKEALASQQQTKPEDALEEANALGNMNVAGSPMGPVGAKAPHHVMWQGKQKQKTKTASSLEECFGAMEPVDVKVPRMIRTLWTPVEREKEVKTGSDILDEVDVSNKSLMSQMGYDYVGDNHRIGSQTFIQKNDKSSKRQKRIIKQVNKNLDKKDHLHDPPAMGISLTKNDKG